jgi:hypothetical protein
MAKAFLTYEPPVIALKWYLLHLMRLMYVVCSGAPSHLDSTSEVGLSLGGYFCPQCHAKHTELPVECKICGMYACMVMSEREYN